MEKQIKQSLPPLPLFPQAAQEYGDINYTHTNYRNTKNTEIKIHNIQHPNKNGHACKEAK